MPGESLLPGCHPAWLPGLTADARHFKRAVRFKVYLTNPSIRAALFAPVEENDDAMGALVETAIFAQWLHSDAELHYARWQGGEVDLVILDPAGRPSMVVEAKWSDRVVDRPKELSPLIRFIQRNCSPHSPVVTIVTTRTTLERREIDGVTVDFVPASVFCYGVGRGLVQLKGRRSSGSA